MVTPNDLYPTLSRAAGRQGRKVTVPDYHRLWGGGVSLLSNDIVEPAKVK